MIGIDEVGRGCLAGPLLVVAARQKGRLPKDIKDSKLLTRATRESLFEVLVDVCDFGEGWVTSSEIDKQGLAKAMRLGVARALKNLSVTYAEPIIMDGRVNYLPRKFNNIECLVGADATVRIVSAASVYAKVRRDRYMIKLAKKYAGYGFENHVGYGTRQHQTALRELGPIQQVHRRSFKPVYLLNNLDV
jgi:ribonuclease HII